MIVSFSFAVFYACMLSIVSITPLFPLLPPSALPLLSPTPPIITYLTPTCIPLQPPTFLGESSKELPQTELRGRKKSSDRCGLEGVVACSQTLPTLLHARCVMHIHAHTHINGQS